MIVTLTHRLANSINTGCKLRFVVVKLDRGAPTGYQREQDTKSSESKISLHRGGEVASRVSWTDERLRFPMRSYGLLGEGRMASLPIFPFLCFAEFT